MTVWWNCTFCKVVTDEFESPNGETLCPKCRNLEYLQIEDIRGLDLDAGLGLTKTLPIYWNIENEEVTESLKEVFIQNTKHTYIGAYCSNDNYERYFKIYSLINESVDLLPCPFCGSSADNTQGFHGLTVIGCNNCEVAQTPPFSEYNEAAAVWNLRLGMGVEK